MLDLSYPSRAAEGPSPLTPQQPTVGHGANAGNDGAHHRVGTRSRSAASTPPAGKLGRPVAHDHRRAAHFAGAGPNTAAHAAHGRARPARAGAVTCAGA